MRLIRYLVVASAMLFCLSTKAYASNDDINVTEFSEAFKDYLERTWQRHGVLPEELESVQVFARPTDSQPKILFEVLVPERFHEKYFGPFVIGEILLEKYYYGRSPKNSIPAPSSIDMNEVLDREKFPCKGLPKVSVVYSVPRD